jgi:single stranded DNA-binding protein
MISRAPAISGTTPAPGYRASSTVGKIAEQGPLTCLTEAMRWRGRTPAPRRNLRAAVTHRIQQDGQWRDGDTNFFKVNVWRGQAEHLAESLGKGDRVMVTGRLRQRSWETPEGDKRSVTELEADEVGASLKWATAKVERTSQRGNGDRAQGRERAAERGGDFNDAPPTY